MHHSVAGSSRAGVRWKRPRANEVKVNWDAAFDSRRKRKGAGIIIRDGGW